jgi:hypothetical protein
MSTIRDPENEMIEAEVNTDSEALDGKNVVVDIVDDTPDSDKNRPRRPDSVEPDIPDDDEIQQYGKDVQKRLNKLKWEFHEERRRKEEAMRQTEEAARFAKAMYEQNQRLQNTVRGGEKVLVDQAKGRVDAELAQAKADYKSAYEAGDTEALIRAQERISELKIQADRVANYQPTQFEEPPPIRIQQPQPQPQQPDPLFNDWRAKNERWFGRDDEMTSFALGVHKKLVESGVDPRSKEYYNKIDTRMREVFPNSFSAERASGSPARPRGAGNVVAPAVRTSGSSGGNSPRSVQITASQAQLARRLGLTPEQYAAQILKENQ